MVKNYRKPAIGFLALSIEVKAFLFK